MIDSWQLKQILKLYIYFIVFHDLISKALWTQWFKMFNHCFEVTVQIFVYKLLFTIVFFGKMKKNLTKPFTQFSHFENECTFRKRTHFENECTFRKRTTFWKWKCVFGKVKVINHFLKKLQLANSLKKVSRMFVGAKFDWLISSNPEFFPSESCFYIHHWHW